MKSQLKKVLIFFAIAAIILSFGACGKQETPQPSTQPDNSAANTPADTSADTSSDSYKFGIITLVENGAFNDMREGIVSGLASAGYTEANTEIVYKCASGDTTTLSSICGSMDDGSYDAVFTIATPATQQFVNLGSDTPCFFCSVSAPVAAGVLSDMASPDKNATGTSNAIPVSDIFDLANTLTPDISKWGFIYCASEVNAANTVSSGEAYLSDAGIDYVSKTINNSAEIATVCEALLADGCDAIFVPNDSVVQSGVTSLVESCRDAGIPTYCCSATTVASGCLATVAIDDKGIGEKTAAMAAEYLSGKAVSEIPSVVVAADYVSVNRDTFTAALGGSMDKETLEVGGKSYSLIYF